VVILGMAERAGQRISFWEFTTYGLVVTVITIASCVPYLWLRYFAFGWFAALHAALVRCGQFRAEARRRPGITIDG
jgi:hypothetical protein